MSGWFSPGRFEVPSVQCVTYLTLLKLIKTCWVRHDEINILNYGDYGLMLTSGIKKITKEKMLRCRINDEWMFFNSSWAIGILLQVHFTLGNDIVFADGFHSPFSHVLHVGCIPVNPLAAVAALPCFRFSIDIPSWKKNKKWAAEEWGGKFDGMNTVEFKDWLSNFIHDPTVGNHEWTWMNMNGLK